MEARLICTCPQVFLFLLFQVVKIMMVNNTDLERKH